MALSTNPDRSKTLLVKAPQDASTEDVIGGLDQPLSSRPIDTSKGATPRVDLSVSEHGMLRTFFDDSPLGFAICQLDGTFLKVNQAYADIHKRDIGEFRELKYTNLTPEDYTAADQEQIAILMTKRQFGPFDKHYIRPDKTFVRVRISLKLITVNGEDCIWAAAEEIASQ